MTTDTIAIVISPQADELERFAAEQLKDYLRRLFELNAPIVNRRPPDQGTAIVLGMADAAHVQGAASSLPRLSDQGHLVRKVDADTMVLAGGSPAAVAWAVYELVEHYGVTFLLHNDVFPKAPGRFHLPDLDVVLEPQLALRSWRQFNDLPTGPVLWTLAQQKAFIGQVFKLKFNGIYLCLWPHHPGVDIRFKGIRRKDACVLFGQKIPVDHDTIGREHIPEGEFLNNPELAGAETFDEKLQAGRRLIGGIIEQARFFQMRVGIHFQLLEFPVEFAALVDTPSANQLQLGGLTCTHRGDLMAPDHVGLVEAVFRAFLEQWSVADEFHLIMPEHPHAERTFEHCWQELDEQYGLEKDTPLQDLITAAQRNYLIPGGLDRATREFRSSISMLHFFDRFFASNRLLEDALAQGIGVHLNLGGNTEALFPVLNRVMWPGGGISTSMGYTSSRAVRVMHHMASLDTARVPAALVLTLQDDNVGSLPQVATESIHALIHNARRLGWRGFLTRHWPVGDLDPTITYVARAAWRADETVHGAYVRHFERVYGAAAVSDMCQVMRLLEEATLILDLDFLSLFFPVLDAMLSTMQAQAPMAEGLFHVRAIYEQAQRILDSVQVDSDAGRAELDYWRGRLSFAVQALIEKDQLHEGGMQLHAANEASDEETRQRHLSQVSSHFERAVGAGEQAVRALANEIRDDSDRNTVAAYYHFFVRQVRQTAAQLVGGESVSAGRRDPM